MDTKSDAPAFSNSRPCRIGILVFEGFEAIDVYGPLEVFANLAERVQIEMLGPKAGALLISEQAPAVAQATIALSEAGALDLLLVPGGVGTRKLAQDKEFLDTLANVAASAQWVASVCTGAGLLAAAGLLHGARATTNKSVWSWVVEQSSDTDWIPEARWVEDGKLFTSGGACAGMDMSLGIVARFFGDAVARELAKLIEYDWNDDAGYDPFAAAFGLV